MTIGGVTYAVFSTGVAGLGIVFQWHPIYASASMGTYEPLPDVPLTTAYETTAGIWNHTGIYEDTDTGVAIQARYVKTGTIAPGTVLPAKANARIGDATLRFRDDGSSAWYPLTNWYAASPINMTQLQSTFPVLGCLPTTSVVVPMGTFSTSLFQGVDTRVGQRSFTIPLTNCPAGMGGISFSLNPVSGSFGPPSGGVANLTPGTGVATGVGLQITRTGSSGALAFGVNQTFREYTGAAGNYAIPLDAAYYQTGAAVGAGTANSQVEFTITYQ